MSDARAANVEAVRLAKLRVDELDEAQRALYDAIAGGPRAAGPQAFRLTDGDGGLEGPFNAMLLSPPVGSALQALGSRLRYGSQLTARTREIVILVVAHHWASNFEVHAHEAVGAQAGLSTAELAALREGRLDGLDDPSERLAAETAAALAAHGDLDDAQYAAAGELGAAVLFEITTFVGYYAALALQLRVYRVPLPQGVSRSS